MPMRTAHARWEGSGKIGKGEIDFRNGLFRATTRSGHGCGGHSVREAKSRRSPPRVRTSITSRTFESWTVDS
jgi:hypothetical protein